MQGMLGKKVGMTRVFDESGRQIPVTVLEVGPCVVLQKKTQDAQGYDAVQFGFEEKKESRTTKPEMGQFKKAGTTAKKHVREFRVGPADGDVSVGDVVTVGVFEGASYVDVTGISKGRGFQGVVRRYRMHGGRMTHGGHARRRPGSIGPSAYPARVAKGKKMPGHMGNKRVTTQNVAVVQVALGDNVLIVRGCVPGPAGGLVEVRTAIKKQDKTS